MLRTKRRLHSLAQTSASDLFILESFLARYEPDKEAGMRKQKAKSGQTHVGEGGRVFEEHSDGKKGHKLLNEDYQATDSTIRSPPEAKEIDPSLPEPSQGTAEESLEEHFELGKRERSRKNMDQKPFK